MIEPEIENDAEQTRSRAVIWVSAAAILLLIVLAVLLISSKPQNRAVLERPVRAGAPEFEGYKDKIQLEVIDRIVHPNMMGLFQMEAKARMYNRGDRPLSGVEVLGKIIKLDDTVINESTSIPIPRVRTAPLKPGESFAFSVKVDAPGKITEDDVKDITVELKGLQFE